MKKQLSCGFVLIDPETHAILGVHPTGRSFHGNHCYDIPKGHIEEGETPLDCAVRELFEETNIQLNTYEILKAKDMGVFTYTSAKDLHIFSLEYSVDMSKLKCTSTFTTPSGKIVPENNGFKMISDTSDFYKSLQPVIELVKSRLHLDQ